MKVFHIRRVYSLTLFSLLAFAATPAAGQSDLVRSYYECGDEWMKKKEYDRAIADYREAVRLNPRHTYSLCQLGCAHGPKGLRPGHRRFLENHSD